jgi:hypothetical protein
MIVKMCFVSPISNGAAVLCKAIDLVPYALVCKAWLHVLDLFWNYLQSDLGKSIYQFTFAPAALVRTLKIRPELATKIRTIDYLRWMGYPQRHSLTWRRRQSVERLIAAQAALRDILEMAHNHLTTIIIRHCDFIEAEDIFKNLPSVRIFSVTAANTVDKEASMLSIQSAIQDWKHLESLHIRWMPSSQPTK